MAEVIAIVNQKGGVGKTTTATNLGAYLAALGKFVLLVDFDPQGNASSGLGIKTPEDKNLYHTIIEDRHINDIIKTTSMAGFKVAPSNNDLAGANVELVNLENREFKLYEALKAVRNDYDYILIDCPPSLGLLTINALVASDKILMKEAVAKFWNSSTYK